MNRIVKFYSVSPVKPLISDNANELEKKYKRLKWSTFLAATLVMECIMYVALT